MNRRLHFNVVKFISIFLYGTHPKVVNILLYNFIGLSTFTIKFLTQREVYLYDKGWAKSVFHFLRYGWSVILASFVEPFSRVVTLNLEWACPRIIRELLQTAPLFQFWQVNPERSVCICEKYSSGLRALCSSLRTTAVEREYLICLQVAKGCCAVLSVSKNCFLVLFRANWLPSLRVGSGNLILCNILLRICVLKE